MNKWLKRGIYAAIGVAVVGGGAAFVLEQWMMGEDAPKFRTQEVDRGAITQVVLASGALQPVTSVSVGTQVSGTVLERLADFNDRVKKNQVLLRLDPALSQARVRQASAQVRSADASLAVARSGHERNLKLQAQGFISGSVVEQSKQAFDAALANLEVAKAQLDSAVTDVNNSVIRSPIDGVVTKRSVDVGQTVAASFQTPELFTIAQDLKKMQIFSNVSEADVGLVREGQAVRFVVDAYPDREFDGKVEQFRLSPNNQSGVVTYNIVIDVDNADEQLKPGMTAQTRIVVSSKQNVVRIPSAALRFKPEEDDLTKKEAKKADRKDAKKEEAAKAADPSDDGALSSLKAGTRVFRVYTVGEANMPQPHDITIGIANTRFTEMVTGDIKPGDALITRTLGVAPNAAAD